MSQFSDDGQWWWDGERWIATSTIVLPDLPMTEFEPSGKLRTARSRMRKREWLLVASLVGPLAVPYVVARERAFRDYRLWTLEQLALTASYLLGPNDPMLAGETTMFSSSLLGTVIRDLAVVVTGAHVLVLRIDFLDGQPQWVVLAARPNDVKIEVPSRPSGLNPTLLVTRGTGTWTIRGDQRVFQPDLVLAAWRKAAGSVSNTA